MRINAVVTWLALAATWVWLANAYINGTAALRIVQGAYPICDEQLDNRPIVACICRNGICGTTTQNN